MRQILILDGKRREHQIFTLHHDEDEKSSLMKTRLSLGAHSRSTLYLPIKYQKNTEQTEILNHKICLVCVFVTEHQQQLQIH